MDQNKILVSACLLGERVRYDGKIVLHDNGVLKKLQKEGRVISICPEVEGGLSVPRDPAEIVGDKVITTNKKDVTKEFHKGALLALELVKKHGIKVAILKSNSPSCSCKFVYDGTFSKKLIKGKGVCAKLLQENGVKVFDERDDLGVVLAYL